MTLSKKVQCLRILPSRVFLRLELSGITTTSTRTLFYYLKIAHSRLCVLDSCKLYRIAKTNQKGRIVFDCFLLNPFSAPGIEKTNDIVIKVYASTLMDPERCVKVLVFHVLSKNGD